MQENNEFSMKLRKKDYPEFNHDIWVNPNVYKALIKKAKQEFADGVEKDKIVCGDINCNAPCCISFRALKKEHNLK